jgi:MFS family permease
MAELTQDQGTEAKARGGMTVTKTFSALRIPAYRFLWLSMCCSFLGMQMQIFARGLLAYQLGGTASAIGVVSLGFAIPQLLFSLIGGTVADRVERRKLMMISQAGTATVAVTVAVLVETGHMTVPLLFVTGLFQGTVFAFSGPARQAFVPEVVGQDQVMNAIALSNAGMNLSRIAGPSLAGALVAVSWIDLQGLYFLQGLLNVVSLLLLLLLPALSKGQVKAADREAAADQGHAVGRRRGGRAPRSGSVFGDLTNGMRYVWRSPILLTLLMMGLVPTFVGMSYQSYLPVFAKNVFGDGVHRNAAAIGFMGTMSGIGALIGSLAVASLSDYRRRTQIQLAAGLGYGLFLAFFAMQTSFTMAALALVGVGFMSSFFQSLNSTMVMTASDPEYYGRVMSVNMLTFSLMPIGSFVMGYVIDAIGEVALGPLELIGVQMAYVGAGAIITLFVLSVTLLNPSYRRLEQDDIRGFAESTAESLRPAAEPLKATAK